MLKSLLPKAHARMLALPLLGPIAEERSVRQSLKVEMYRPEMGDRLPECQGGMNSCQYVRPLVGRDATAGASRKWLLPVDITDLT